MNWTLPYPCSLDLEGIGIFLWRLCRFFRLYSANIGPESTYTPSAISPSWLAGAATRELYKTGTLAGDSFASDVPSCCIPKFSCCAGDAAESGGGDRGCVLTAICCSTSIKRASLFSRHARRSLEGDLRLFFYLYDDLWNDLPISPRKMLNTSRKFTRLLWEATRTQ